MIGYRATGKSTVGRLVAGALGVPFHDTDQIVEESLGLSIAEYFDKAGEATFRRKESEALRQAIQATEASRGGVVATGGGIILQPGNVQAMRAAGRVAWLTAASETIRARLTADPRSVAARPALSGRSAVDEVEAVLGGREPRYRAAADVEVSTEGRSPSEVAAEILGWLKTTGLTGARRG